MLAQIKTVGLNGIDGFAVSVQADVSNGLPSFDIIGLPDASVKEAKERAKTAIKNSGGHFPARHITINLSPASAKKTGSSYDFPISVALLAATNQIKIIDNELSIFIGELSLDGSIMPVTGVLPMVISAYKSGFSKFYVPLENADEAAVIKEVEIYPVKNIKDLINHFNGDAIIEPHYIDVDDYFENNTDNSLDFADVKGQDTVKRALEIAAAGNHNVLMIGSPGTGKTMLAKRMTSILPDLTFDEALEVSKIHSIAGLLPPGVPLIKTRPFRSPHHTTSSAGLAGGGAIPRPGEFSLAHNGILFLDELPEFRRDTLEVLRQPLENRRVTVARASGIYSYPCNVMLVASMNPCKCGYYGDPYHKCSCTRTQINTYRNKISGPFLDRIDIQVEVTPVNFEELNSKERGESSAEIKKRVNKARQIQQERFKNIFNISSNAQMSEGQIEQYCKIDEKSTALLKNAFENLGFSARAHSRILKVARTIADLEGEENIRFEHVAEAIQYRSLDRKFFG